jgi:type I restriction enzyme R subunit
VYRYQYERAVREGYLVDYDVVTVKSNVRMQGVFLKQGEQVSFVDPETGSKQLDDLKTSGNTTRRTSRRRSHRPIRTAKYLRRSKSTHSSMKPNTSGFLKF